MRQILLRLAEMDKTLIVTSHILPELSRICDTVAIIIQGKLRAFGSLEKIMRQISQRRVFELIMIDAEHVTRLSETLQKMLGPEDEITPSEAEAEIRFTTDKTDEELAAILSKITAAGLKVAQFREVPLDLEDAFLSVTRDVAGGSGERSAESEEPVRNERDTKIATDEHR